MKDKVVPISGKTAPASKRKRKVRDTNGRFVGGNPGGPGRPRGKSIQDALKDVLANHKKYTAEAVALAAFALAVDHKNLQAIMFITDRIDGKTSQPVDITARIIEVAEAMGIDPQDAIAEAESYIKGR